MKKYVAIVALSAALSSQGFAFEGVSSLDLTEVEILKTSSKSLMLAEEVEKKESSVAPLAATETQTQGWGEWFLNKATYAAQAVIDNGGRGALGYTAAAYVTPCLNPVVGTAGELADWGVSAAVTSVTGCYPLGWVAGKVAKTGTVAAGNYIAPKAAFALGYYTPDIAYGAYTGIKYIYNFATAS